MLNPILWKKVQGQKHSETWEIAERQMANVKMLFETNAKGHKHPSFRLFIIEGDTIGHCNYDMKSFKHRGVTQHNPCSVTFLLWFNDGPSFTDTEKLNFHHG